MPDVPASPTPARLSSLTARAARRRLTRTGAAPAATPLARRADRARQERNDRQAANDRRSRS